MNEEIIVKACGDVEERVKSCRSRTVAEHLKRHLCEELQLNCENKAINNLLEKHIDELILQYFDQGGHNILINVKKMD